MLLGKHAAAIERAITRTLPTEEGERHLLLFQFCRALKGIPEIRGLPAAALRPVAREWHRRALPFISTKPFDLSWADFVSGWRSVKYALEESPLTDLAKELPSLPLPPEAALYESPDLQRYMAGCVYLQRQAGNKPFFWSCRKAEELLKVNPSTVSRWFLMLQADGLLELATPGTQTRAARWRWKGQR